MPRSHGCTRPWRRSAISSACCGRAPSSGPAPKLPASSTPRSCWPRTRNSSPSVESLIRKNLLSAESAYEFRALELRNAWQNGRHAMLRDRLADLHAIQLRMLLHLLGRTDADAWVGEIREPVVLVAHELSPGLDRTARPGSRGGPDQRGRHSYVARGDPGALARHSGGDGCHRCAGAHRRGHHRPARWSDRPDPARPHARRARSGSPAGGAPSPPRAAARKHCRRTGGHARTARRSRCRAMSTCRRRSRWRCGTAPRASDCCAPSS